MIGRKTSSLQPLRNPWQTFHSKTVYRNPHQSFFSRFHLHPLQHARPTRKAVRRSPIYPPTSLLLPPLPRLQPRLHAHSQHRDTRLNSLLHVLFQKLWKLRVRTASLHRRLRMCSSLPHLLHTVFHISRTNTHFNPVTGYPHNPHNALPSHRQSPFLRPLDCVLFSFHPTEGTGKTRSIFRRFPTHGAVDSCCGGGEWERDGLLY